MAELQFFRVQQISAWDPVQPTSSLARASSSLRPLAADVAFLRSPTFTTTYLQCAPKGGSCWQPKEAGDVMPCSGWAVSSRAAEQHGSGGAVGPSVQVQACHPGVRMFLRYRMSSRCKEVMI